MKSIWDRLPNGRLLADVSLWSADLGALGQEVLRMDPYADLFHIDVADAHFVPSLLFFPDLVAAIRRFTTKPFHVHLMVDRPDMLVDGFIHAGADLVTLHLENSYMEAGIDAANSGGAQAGIAIQLDTDISRLVQYLDKIQIIVLMGTMLGIKGVSLDDRVLQKIGRVQRMISENGQTGRIKISADGGIRMETVPKLRQAGADIVTPGSLIFKSQDLEQTISWLRAL